MFYVLFETILPHKRNGAVETGSLHRAANCRRNARWPAWCLLWYCRGEESENWEER